MTRWPQIKNIFSLHFFLGHETEEEGVLNREPNPWKKIKFDNTIRISIAIPSFLACLVLWTQGAVTSMSVLTGIFVLYGILTALACWLFLKMKTPKPLDFALASLDLLAMSVAVTCTGGADSPLYFVYFIPLVVHVFHRQMGVVVYSGLGGVILYAIAVGATLTSPTNAFLINLGTRMFFMLLTVGIACLSLIILRKQDAGDQKRTLRLKNLAQAYEAVNHMTVLGERNETAVTLIRLINEGLGPNFHSWSRFFFIDKDQISMKAVSDPACERLDLKHEWPIAACPVLQGNDLFLMDSLHEESECPTEKFSFGSHVCLPVSGTENENFGVLFVGSPAPQPFKKTEINFLNFVARSFGLAIQRLHRMEELRAALEMNSWVMAATIASSRSAASTYQAVLDGMTAILKADAVELTLMEPRTKMLQVVLRQPADIVEGPTTDFSLKSCGGEELGIIRAVRKDFSDNYSDIQLEMAATFSARAALAIENAIAHEWQREKIQCFEEGRESKKAA